MITLDEAENLAMGTDYAVNAVGEQINTADAGAFFFEGYKHAETELKDIAVEFANYYADMVMAAYNRDADTDLFAKFLEERSGK